VEAKLSAPGPGDRVEDAVRRERPRLLDFIRRRVGDASDAEDLLQDVFQQLAASDGIAGPIEDLTAWLFTVARHKVIDWYRRRRPEARPRFGGADGSDLEPEEVLFDPADGPDHALWRSEFWSALVDALDELPAAQRDVFVAHELEGVSFKELARRTGEPLNTLLSRKRYAVLFLRQRLRGLRDEVRWR
jgi:RNA polymerase sigma factor (sigma-70 family)